MATRVSRASLIAVLLVCSPAPADSFDSDSPRSIGRAGATLVSDDSGNAVLVNPGSLVRRMGWRFQLGVGIHDRNLHYRPFDSELAAVDDHGPPATAPHLAVQGSIGPVVAGLVYHSNGSRSAVLPDPDRDMPPDQPPDPNQDPAALAQQYPHRYVGTSLTHQRQTLAVGAAVRAGTWLGMGAALALTRVRLAERRHIWTAPRQLTSAYEPQNDVAIAVSGRDNLVPGVHGGVLVAPPHLPAEMALAVSYTARAHLRGEASAVPGNHLAQPNHQIIADVPTSQSTLASSLMARIGFRYLGERILLEINGDVTAYLDDEPTTWHLAGIAIEYQDQIPVDVTHLPSLVARRLHGTIRTAADIEISAGFLWLSLGYALHTGATAREQMNPVHADVRTHTLAVGAEVYWKNVTMTVGYQHALARAVEVHTSEVLPIALHDVPVSSSSARGTYNSARNAFGAALEFAWE